MSAVAGGQAAMVAPEHTVASRNQFVHVDVRENDPIVVTASDSTGHQEQYWVRCLPHDFPRLKITTHPENGAPTPGYYLTGNLFPNATTGAYAMILDTNGVPVWYRHGSQGTAINVTPVGTNKVAFMKNAPGPGFGTNPNGGYDVYDLAKGKIKEVRTVGTPTDLHEFQPLPNGDDVMLSYPLMPNVDLRPLGGPANATIANCIVQEVSPQGQVVWQWRATDHVDPNRETIYPVQQMVNGTLVYDVFHCNSVDVNDAGDFLVSMRHLSAVFKIDRTTGRIIFKIGGKPYNKDGAQLIRVANDPEGGFSQQHDARFQAGNDITLFDNHSPDLGPARGLELAIDRNAGTATPVFMYLQPKGNATQATGSFRRYPDGESVICWGINVSRTTFTEINALGKPVLDVAFDKGINAYRAVKAPLSEFDINVLRFTAGLRGRDFKGPATSIATPEMAARI
jgi:hypothetical protein